MPSPAERLEILNEVNVYATEELTDLWRGASGLPSDEFRQVLIDGVPEIVDPHAAMAADYAVDWYTESDPSLPFTPTPAALPERAALQQSAAWALGAVGEAALVRFAGFTQRAIFDASRDTMVSNAEREPGARWVRHARPAACAFCRMLATRTETATYTSRSAALSVVGRGQEMTDAERRARARGDSRISGRFISGGSGRTRGSRSLGEKYHDYCRCTAVEVRPGQTYLPPDYVQDWEKQYVEAVRNTDGVGPNGAIDTSAVLSYMRRAEAGRVPAARTATAATTATQRAADTTRWLAAEAEYKSAVSQWLAAEQAYVRSRPAVKLTEAQGRTRGAATWRAYSEGLSPADAVAMRVYTGNEYEFINGALRADDLAGLSVAQRESVDIIDRVIEAAPRVPENTTVSRAVGADVFGLTADSDISSVVGRSYRDNAYVSTALQSKLDGVERYEVELRLDVPAGTRGVYVSSHDGDDPRALAVFGQSENELVLGRGIDYDVIDAYVEDRRRVIVARITGQDVGGVRSGQSR